MRQQPMTDLKHRIPAFVESAKRTHRDGFTEASVTIMFSCFACLFAVEAWDMADAVIEKYIGAEMPNLLMLTMLTATLVHKDKLPSRKKFFDAFPRHSMTDDFLAGLE